jgi:hypothetical protein
MLEEKGVVERHRLEGRNMFIAWPGRSGREEEQRDRWGDPASATNGETIGDMLAARLTAEPGHEQAQHAENEEPQGNSRGIRRPLRQGFAWKAGAATTRDREQPQRRYAGKTNVDPSTTSS